MKKLLLTNGSNTTALAARIALGIVLLPHGAQKLLGWFGGYGFNGTMNFMTSTAGLPWIIALLVILVEFFGSLFLIFGFATRFAAFAVIVNFLGVVLFTHAYSAFFMNWYQQANQREGLEYFILLFGLAIVAFISGGGKASIDALITRKDFADRSFQSKNAFV